MPSERVQRKDGSYVTVVAPDKGDLSDAVKAAKESNPTSSININRPVKEGEDLVVVNADGSMELSDRVPEDALNFNPDVDQRFNAKVGVGGDSSNSPAAKAAAEAKADEALATRGPSTDAEMAEAKASTRTSSKSS